MRSWELRGFFEGDWHEADRMEADVARGGCGGGEIWRWRWMWMEMEADGDQSGWR